jgi:hypothetical protein
MTGTALAEDSVFGEVRMFGILELHSKKRHWIVGGMV